jgi:hypothetical protein
MLPENVEDGELLIACYWQVLLYDFGYREHVKLSMLRPLVKQFEKEPVMCAARCHLVGILPVDGSSKWPSDACKFLSQVMQDKRVYLDIKVCCPTSVTALIILDWLSVGSTAELVVKVKLK